MSDRREASFGEADREAIYRCIGMRRDVRGQFLPDPVDDAVLARILGAAHLAPSVGFMQPWDFVVVRDVEVKRRVRQAFERANAEAAAQFEGERASRYMALKLQGIEEAPIGICVTCDVDREGATMLGRTHQPDMELFSVVCAIQNLWLAARAENIGVGWVSIVRPEDLHEALGVPESVRIVAWLCVGHVTELPAKPELETSGWLPRQALADRIAFDRWGRRDDDDPLIRALA